MEKRTTPLTFAGDSLAKSRSLARCVLLAMAGFVVSVGVAQAAPLYWWPGAAAPEGGSGTWTTSQTNWSTTPSVRSSPTVASSSSDDVFFRGTPGTVGLAGTGVALANSVAVNVSGYIFGGSGMTVGSFVVAEGATATLQHAGNTTWGITDAATQSTFRGTFSDGASAMNFFKTGAGLLDLTNVTAWHTGITYSRGGALRLSIASLPTGNIRLGDADGTSGILEVAGGGTFSRSIGASAGQILLGNGGADRVGFGASGGNATISTGVSANWGATAGSGNLRSATFQLGTATSTGSTIYTTNLQLFDASGQTLTVGDGTSAIDADYTGELTRGGASTADSVLVRDGTGTLRLSGDSTAFNMRLDQQGGTTLIDGGLTSNTTNATYGILVNDGAVLGGDGLINFAGSSVEVAGTLMAGRTGAIGQSLSINSDVNLLSDSTLRFELGADVGDESFLTRDGGDWLFQTDQQVQLTVGGAFLGGSGFELIRGLSFVPGYDVSGWQIVNSSAIESGSFYYALGSGGDYSVFVNVTAVPEPASVSLLMALAAGGLLTYRRFARR